MNRVSLKSKAKYVLKRHFLLLFIVSLVLAFVGGNAGGVAGHSKNGNHPYSRVGSWADAPANVINEVRSAIRNADLPSHFSDYGEYTFNGFMDRLPFSRVINFIVGAGVAVLSLALALLAIGFAFLIAFPLKIGGARIYVDTVDGEATPNLGRLLFAFREGRFKNAAKAGLLTGLYTFLWSLLFVIPGVVKAYAYSMVPYILAEDPHMSASDAINLSVNMTRGHKWELFVMDLSFIGWYILGGLLFGFGVLLVHPYKDATWAQAYVSLRGAAVYTEPAADYPGESQYAN